MFKKLVYVATFIFCSTICTWDNSAVAEIDKEAANKCIVQADCEDIILCPRNRACLNTCDLGFDPNAAGKIAGNAILAIFGIEDAIKTDTVKSCRTNCIANLLSDCKSIPPGCNFTKDNDCRVPVPQPVDIAKFDENPPTTDPARNCREYCGATYPAGQEKMNYEWCQNTCKNFDQCSGPNGNTCSPDQVEQIVKNFNAGPGFANQTSNIRIKLRGFAKEAECVKLQGKDGYAKCIDELCKSHGNAETVTNLWTRSCLMFIGKQMQAAAQKQQMLEESLANAVGAAGYGTKEGAAVVDKAEKSVNETLDWDRQQEAEFEKKQAAEKAALKAKRESE